MIYSLLVLSSPTAGHGARHAAAFAQQLLAGGHRVHRIFFMDDGTACAAAAPVYPQDERNPLQAWLDLTNKHGVELVLCVSSALKRGMLDSTESLRHERPGATIHPAFIISGLGQLIDAFTVSDRLITFGG